MTPPRIKWLAVLALGLVAACAQSPYQPPPRERTADKAQKKLFAATMNLFLAHSPDELSSSLIECRKYPVVGAWVAREMIAHMLMAAKAQRHQQSKSYALRTLEKNPRYTLARRALVELGRIATRVVIDECMAHPYASNRKMGESILSLMPPAELPTIVAASDSATERYRHGFVLAIAAMPASPEVEAQLLAWAKSPGWRVRAQALVGLTAYGEKHSDLLLTAVAKDEDAFVQRKVVENLGSFRTRRAAATVVEYYGRRFAARDRAGIVEAERTLIKISGRPATRGKRRLNYGLPGWRQWLKNLPENVRDLKTRGGR